MRHWLTIFGGIALCFVVAPAAADTLDAVAQDYLVVMLAAHELDPELVAINEARPRELEAARSARLDAPAVADRATSLVDRLDRLPRPAAAMDAMRLRRLRAMLESLRMHMAIKVGASPSVADQVRVQYAVKEPFKPLADYDAALGRLEAAMPGPGSLADRIASLRGASIVPPERLEAVFNAALAECRKRTLAHLQLPPDRPKCNSPTTSIFPPRTSTSVAARA